MRPRPGRRPDDRLYWWEVVLALLAGVLVAAIIAVFVLGFQGVLPW
jgi:hypothetical protein